MSLSVTQLIGFAAEPPASVTYRYLRLRIDSTVAATAMAILWELDWSNDGGSTLYPTSNMTTNSAPSPLVASADSEFSGSFQAFLCFDGNNATRWTSANSAMPHYIQLDLGSGNGIAPNWIRWRVYNDGTDYSPASGAIMGSNTGSFAGEETTFQSFSGLSGNAGGTDVTRSW